MNLVLIGMPAAGKSSVGVLVAKALGLSFVDTDLVIQAATGRRLQRIIEEDGRAEFGRIEEAQVLAIDVDDTVISTGGSVVYSAAAVAHLRRNGTLIFLDVPLDEIRGRIGDLAERGFVRGPGQSLEAVYAERRPLYERAADVVVDCGGCSAAGAASRVLDAWRATRLGPS